MSLNIISKAEIKELTQFFLDIALEQEKKQLKDMKEQLKNTNISTEQKVKEYSSFSASLFNIKLSTALQTAQQYIIRDKELYQQKLVNTANIDLTNKQIEVAEQTRLDAIQKVSLTTEQVNQAKEETKAIKTKTFLEIIKTEVTIDNTIASTLTEVRKNGATPTITNRTYTDSGTGQVVNYNHISLAAASVTDQSSGMYGLQMLLLQKQADTFKDHTKLQYANQVMQLSSTAISESITSIKGLLNTHKNIGESLLGNELFETDYSTIE